MVDSVECLAKVHKQGKERASFTQSLTPRMNKKTSKHETCSGPSNNQIGYGEVQELEHHEAS